MSIFLWPAEMVRVASASQITMSASDPTWILPCKAQLNKSTFHTILHSSILFYTLLFYSISYCTMGNTIATHFPWVEIEDFRRVSAGNGHEGAHVQLPY